MLSIENGEQVDVRLIGRHPMCMRILLLACYGAMLTACSPLPSFGSSQTKSPLPKQTSSSPSAFPTAAATPSLSASASATLAPEPLWTTCPENLKPGAFRDLVYLEASQTFVVLTQNAYRFDTNGKQFRPENNVYEIKGQKLDFFRNDVGQCLNPDLRKAAIERDGQGNVWLALPWSAAIPDQVRLLKISADRKQSEIVASIDIEKTRPGSFNLVDSLYISDFVVQPDSDKVYLNVDSDDLNDDCSIVLVEPPKYRPLARARCWNGTVFEIEPSDQTLYLNADLEIHSPYEYLSGKAIEQNFYPAYNPSVTDVVYVQPKQLIATLREHVILKSDFKTGTMQTLAGDGRPGFADGKGNRAQFRYPVALDISKAGDVYIADAGNFALRKVSPLGEVSTVYQIPESQRLMN